MPSATTVSSSVCASRRIASTTASCFGDTTMSSMNDLSIFRMSTGNWRRYDSDEYPVPKSSTAMRTPESRSAVRSSHTRSWSRSSRLSVISSTSADAGTPCRRSAARTSSTNPVVRNCRADTLTLTYGVRPDSRVRRAAAASDWTSTHAPSGTISPLSSARSMNSPGGTMPKVGCVQRTSASKPSAVGSVPPSGSATIGWKCSVNAPSATRS